MRRDIVIVPEEPSCCCFPTSIGLRIWAVVVIALNIVAIVLQRNVTLYIVGGVLTCLSYAYMFYAITAKSQCHMKAAAIILALLVTISIVLSLIGAAVIDYQEVADAYNKTRPSDVKAVKATDLRFITWIAVGVSSALQAIFCSALLGCLRRYRRFIRRIQALPDTSSGV